MVKETKEAVKCIVLFGNAVSKCVNDGLAGNTSIFKDIAAFFPALVALPSALKGIGSVADEINGATAEDKKEIVAMLQGDLNLGSDVIEKYVDQALEILLQFWLMFETK